MLLAFRAPSPLAGLTELPSRMMIAKWGRNESTRGDFTVNEKTMRFMPALQKLLGFNTCSLDFEHNTVPGTDAFKQEQEPKNIAATGTPICVQGEGIFLDNLKWTPHGVKSIKEGLHPDLSPTIKTNEAGEIMFIHSAALCRQGAVPDLNVFSAALTPEMLSAFSATLSNPSKSTPTSMDFKKLLIILLGLDANAADTEIETACKKYAESAGKMGEASKGLEAYSATLKTLGETVTALQTRLDAQERASLIAGAISAGKVIPHGVEIDKLNNAAFKAVLDGLQADQVPLAQRTIEGVKTFSAANTGETDADEIVRKQLGMTKEEWAKK